MTEREIKKILEDERNRKVKILDMYELIEYERAKNSMQSLSFDSARVQGGAGPDNNPFLATTAKILQLEKQIEDLRTPHPLFEKMINILPSHYRKVIIGFYGNSKTMSEVREDWDIVFGAHSKRPSVSSLNKWKREAITFLVETFEKM